MMEGIRFKTDWKQDDMVQLHLDNMRQQLAQLKTALQLAVALNRTIIMPKAGRPCCLQAKAPFAMLGRRHQQEACAASVRHAGPKMPCCCSVPAALLPASLPSAAASVVRPLLGSAGVLPGSGRLPHAAAVCGSHGPHTGCGAWWQAGQ